MAHCPRSDYGWLARCRHIRFCLIAVRGPRLCHAGNRARTHSIAHAMVICSLISCSLFCRRGHTERRRCRCRCAFCSTQTHIHKKYSRSGRDACVKCSHARARTHARVRNEFCRRDARRCAHEMRVRISKNLFALYFQARQRDDDDDNGRNPSLSLCSSRVFGAVCFISFACGFLLWCCSAFAAWLKHTHTEARTLAHIKM